MNCPQNLNLYYKETEKQNRTKIHPLKKSTDENKSSVCDKTNESSILFISVLLVLIAALLISLAANLYLYRLLKEYLSIK